MAKAKTQSKSKAKPKGAGGKVVPSPGAGTPVQQWTNDQLRVYGYARPGPVRDELVARVMREIARIHSINTKTVL